MKNIKIRPFKDNTIEAIIFDLGGVILNLNVRNSIDEFIKLGFSNAEEEMGKILNRIPGDELGIFHLYETGMINSTQFRAGIRKYVDRDLDDRDIDRAWTAMLLDLPLSNFNMMEMISKSFRIFLLSNTNAIHIENLHAISQNNHGFSSLVKLFEKVYYSHEVKMRKPDVEIYHHVLKDAGLNADSTLFIDDSLINVQGAQKAGLHAYHHASNSGLDKIFELQ
jgi:glucose-1-phosphatase